MSGAWGRRNNGIHIDRRGQAKCTSPKAALKTDFDLVMSWMDMLRRKDPSSRPTAFITVKITTSADGHFVKNDSESKTWNFS
jgi:hypothetical protein